MTKNKEATDWQFAPVYNSVYLSKISVVFMKWQKYFFYIINQRLYTGTKVVNVSLLLKKIYDLVKP